RDGRGGVDDPPEGGVHAVAADEQVAGGLRAVGEHRTYTLAGLLGVDQALAVLDADAAAGRLLVQRLVEVGALEGLAGHALQEPGGAGAQVFACATAQHDGRRGEPRGEGGGVRVDDVQRIDSV